MDTVLIDRKMLIELCELAEKYIEQAQVEWVGGTLDQQRASGDSELALIDSVRAIARS